MSAKDGRCDGIINAERLCPNPARFVVKEQGLPPGEVLTSCGKHLAQTVDVASESGRLVTVLPIFS